MKAGNRQQLPGDTRQCFRIFEGSQNESGQSTTTFGRHSSMYEPCAARCAAYRTFRVLLACDVDLLLHLAVELGDLDDKPMINRAEPPAFIDRVTNCMPKRNTE